jgi:hypothetical protein
MRIAAQAPTCGGRRHGHLTTRRAPGRNDVLQEDHRAPPAPGDHFEGRAAARGAARGATSSRHPGAAGLAEHPGWGNAHREGNTTGTRRRQA